MALQTDPRTAFGAPTHRRVSAMPDPAPIGRPNTPASAVGAAVKTANPWLLIGVVMVGYFLGPLYSSVANVALPNFVAAFGSDIDTMEWVITGYMLGYSISMPVAGWLADTYGRRRVYLFGLALFTVMLIAAAFAWNAPSLILFRILQAVGSGLVAPTSMAVVTDVVPAAQRGRALGIWGLGMMMAPSFGPTVSGWIIDTFDTWQLIFMIGVPIGVLGLVLAFLYLPKAEDATLAVHKCFDYIGFAALSLALGAFLTPLSQVDRIGWDDPFVQISFVVAALSFTAFIIRELKTSSPMLDLSLFRDRTFSLAVVLRAVIGLAYYFALFLLPLYTQTVLGWPPTLSGLVLMPAGLFMAVLMPIAGTLSDRIGARPLVIAGVVLAAFGTFLFARIDLDWDFHRILWLSVVRTAPLGLMFTPLTALALSSVPRGRAGSASGIINTVWQVGGSVGIAIGQTFLTARTAARLSDAASSVTLARGTVVDAMTHLSAAVGPQAARIMLAEQVNVFAQVQAYGDTFLLGAIVTAFAIPVALLLPRLRRSA